MELVKVMGKPKVCPRCEGMGCEDCGNRGITIKIRVKQNVHVSMAEYKKLQREADKVEVIEVNEFNECIKKSVKESQEEVIIPYGMTFKGIDE